MKHATEYAKGRRFSTYEPKTGGEVQVRDNQHPKGSTFPGARGVVMIFPTMGGSFATQQLRREAVRLARKVVRSLNG